MLTPQHLPLQLYCRQLTVMFQKAISHRDPALWLHKNDARSTLFTAESLARVLAGTLQDKKLEKACRLFKKLEDSLGQIDDYDQLAKKFLKHKSVNKKEVNYFIKKRNKALEKLHRRLIKKEFYQEKFHYVFKELAVNFNDAALALKLGEHLREEMDKCFRFYMLFENGFNDIEEQVHEIRRKLRWFSIYGRSFNGTIVLEKNKTTYSWEKKFILKKEQGSEFNKLPAHKNFKVHIVFDQKVFYALNHVVSVLGEIKDKGIDAKMLARSIHKITNVPKDEAKLRALKKLETDYTEADLLQQAHDLLRDFFETYGIHKHLLP
jgi:hypothetical protein